MEQLMFVCPTTGRQIESGVETESVTLLRIGDMPVRVHCPACGELHEWRVGEASLTEAA